MFRPNRSIKRSLVPVVTLILGFALVLPSVAFAADPVFKITGKGWGHGIGMSQYGARGYARHGFTYDKILSHYYTGTTLTTLGSEPTVKVAIAVNGSSNTEEIGTYWSFRATDGPLWVAYDGGGTSYIQLEQGVMYTFCSVTSSNDALQIRRMSPDDPTKVVVVHTFSPDVDWISAWERDKSQPNWAGLVEVDNRTGPFETKNLLYHGSLVLNRSTSVADGWLLRNRVLLEDYIKGVTPREMGASWETEAVKAQSVAARSYAYADGLGASAASNGYDVICNTWDQVYNGWGKYDYTVYDMRLRHGDNPYQPGTNGDWLSDPEVEATRLKIVTYGGKVVETFFHSTSGGHTENIENVWYSSSPQPYYQGVEDEYEWDSGSPYTFAWPESIEYTAAELKARLGTLAPDEIVAVRITARGVSGRATQVKVYGADGTEKLISGATFRSRLGLRDTYFEITGGSVRIEGDNRYSTAVEISRRGFVSADAVVLANGAAYADALAASALAGAVPGGAPVLLTTSGSLYGGVISEISRLGATKVYIVGGEGVVSESVLETLRTLPGLSEDPDQRVVRVAGPTRYDTAAAVATETVGLLGDSYDGRVLMVSGESFADAVAASGFANATGVPIVLTRASGVPTPTLDVLEYIGASSTLVVGGTAVVGEDAIEQAGLPAQRIAGGADRYETAMQLAEYLVAQEGFSWSDLYFVSGETLVDALAGGPLVGQGSSVMLFVRRDSMPPSTFACLTAHKGSVVDRFILGGEGAVSNAVQLTIESVR